MTRFLTLVLLTLALVAHAQNFEDEMEAYPFTGYAAPKVAPLPVPVAPQLPRFHFRMPSQRTVYSLDIIGSAILNNAQRMDQLRTAHIRKGKGMQEFNMSMSMLGGAWELIDILPKHHRKRAR